MRGSVSNIDLFRVWRDDEDLDLEWLVSRILSPEQSEPMKVGEAFHKAIELSPLCETQVIEAMGYRFEFLKDCDIELAPARELSLSKHYGELEVRGRVDATTGPLVTDFKTTSQFDADRLMTGYQWRFYLDMTGADRFRWEVFVLKEGDDPKEYCISDYHRLEQRRYPELHADCAKMARQYAEFYKQHLEPRLSLVAVS